MRQPKGVEILDAVTAKALDSEDYRKRLLANPAEVLREEGLTVPNDVKIVIHENTTDTIHLVLPSQKADTIELGQTDIMTIAHHTGGT